MNTEENPPEAAVLSLKNTEESSVESNVRKDGWFYKFYLKRYALRGLEAPVPYAGLSYAYNAICGFGLWMAYEARLLLLWPPMVLLYVAAVYIGDPRPDSPAILQLLIILLILVAVFLKLAVIAATVARLMINTGLWWENLRARKPHVARRITITLVTAAVSAFVGALIFSPTFRASIAKFFADDWHWMKYFVYIWIGAFIFGFGSLFLACILRWFRLRKVSKG